MKTVPTQQGKCERSRPSGRLADHAEVEGEVGEVDPIVAVEGALQRFDLHTVRGVPRNGDAGS
jgi:hypothetical protein